MRWLVVGLLVVWSGMGRGGVWGAEPAPKEFLPLPGPSFDGGRPLMAVLKDRRSTREFRSEPISREHLGNLLWAAFGVNRPETGHRTAPCTMNLRCIDIYVALADGAFRYDSESHALAPVSGEDLRSLTGGQDYVKSAPVAILCVADHAKMAKIPPAEREFYAAADSGFIGQNVYLYCASESLGCVVHMPGNRSTLSEQLGLRSDQKIVLVHSVGYPQN